MQPRTVVPSLGLTALAFGESSLAMVRPRGSSSGSPWRDGLSRRLCSPFIARCLFKRFAICESPRWLDMSVGRKAASLPAVYPFRMVVTHALLSRHSARTADRSPVDTVLPRVPQRGSYHPPARSGANLWFRLRSSHFFRKSIGTMHYALMPLPSRTHSTSRSALPTAPAAHHRRQRVDLPS